MQYGPHLGRIDQVYGDWGDRRLEGIDGVGELVYSVRICVAIARLDEYLDKSRFCGGENSGIYVHCEIDNIVQIIYVHFGAE